MRRASSSKRLGSTTIGACKYFDVFDLKRDEFEAAIKQEEQDRIAYHDSVLNPVRA